MRDIKKIMACLPRQVFILPFLIVLFPATADAAGLLDPAGPVAADQATHFWRVIALTMLAVLPVLVLVPIMLWRYRFRADHSTYQPNWAYSRWLEIAMWGVPVLIIIVLSVFLFRSTERFDPYRQLPGDGDLRVQVVGLDWKWLFLYPDHGIATVGEMAFPTNTSVGMSLTTDTVMQSFIIAQLGGQIYAMPGMSTQLHLLADEAGTFEGENMQYNGMGFTDQKFLARALDHAAFDEWVDRVRTNGILLDDRTYARLAKRSSAAQAQQTLNMSGTPEGILYFVLPEGDFYGRILARYQNPDGVPPEAQPGAPAYDWTRAMLPDEPVQLMHSSDHSSDGMTMKDHGHKHNHEHSYGNGHD